MVLSWVVHEVREAVVNFLIESGAELESKDDEGRMALSWAANFGHKAVVKLLLECGAELDTKDNQGQTPLFWAMKRTLAHKKLIYWESELAAKNDDEVLEDAFDSTLDKNDGDNASKSRKEVVHNAVAREGRRSELQS